MGIKLDRKNSMMMKLEKKKDTKQNRLQLNELEPNLKD
jgi:hypothetical protein